MRAACGSIARRWSIVIKFASMSELVITILIAPVIERPEGLRDVRARSRRRATADGGEELVENRKMRSAKWRREGGGVGGGVRQWRP
jgi:hypothetical protein